MQSVFVDKLRWTRMFCNFFRIIASYPCNKLKEGSPTLTNWRRERTKKARCDSSFVCVNLLDILAENRGFYGRWLPMLKRGRGSSKKLEWKKYLQLLSFCQTIITTLPVEFRNVKTVWNNLNDVDKNMTTLTAMLIAQKERNKNRHEPREAFTNAL